MQKIIVQTKTFKSFRPKHSSDRPWWTTDRLRKFGTIFAIDFHDWLIIIDGLLDCLISIKIDFACYSTYGKSDCSVFHYWFIWEKIHANHHDVRFILYFNHDVKKLLINMILFIYYRNARIIRCGGSKITPPPLTAQIPGPNWLNSFFGSPSGG